MSMYNNFDEEIDVDVLWKKIRFMFKNKNVVKRVSIFREIVRLRYQDGSSMVEHLNTFQGLINHTTSLEVSLVDEVLALLLWDPFQIVGRRFWLPWVTRGRKGSNCF